MHINFKSKNYLYGVLLGTLLSCFTIPFLQKYSETVLKKKQAVEELSDKNILVLDHFDPNDVQINDDDTCDIAHGELISRIIENGLPNYHVDRVETYIRMDSSSFYKHRLINKIFNKKYKAANVSIGAHISFDDLSERTGFDVNGENVASKAKDIKAYLKNNPDKYLMEGNIFFDAKMGGVADFIDVLDSLSAKGTKIYVSTCNEGPNYLNLISLVDGAIVVGASDSLGTKYYSSENSLVTRHADDAVKITKTLEGYSIDGGKTTAFKNTEISKGSNKPYPYAYNGASLATPKILVMDLK